MQRRAEAVPEVEVLRARFDRIRRATVALRASLRPEDHVAQSMPDASPLSWHLAHTSWFFETFVLVPRLPGYRVHHPQYGYLFNSYYNAIGERVERPRRGLMTRPSVDEILRFREHVDRHVERWLDAHADEDGLATLELGLNHEQQHQELMLTDLEHLFAQNPLRPAFRELAAPMTTRATPLAWRAFGEELAEFGHAGEGFAFDNEGPRHRAFVAAFELASRPVTCGEFADFVEDGGYRRADLWLSEGWDVVRREEWRAPLYWERGDGGWREFTLGGMRELDASAPVAHVSYFEADAYARWAGARLPSEYEWELAARDLPIEGNFVESGLFHPRASSATHGGLRAMFGDVWEWTASAYLPYPGFRPATGAIGEYNGKFMCNQFVLRGGSCASPREHLRATYRNFFAPHARWQFSGFRLARDSS